MRVRQRRHMLVPIMKVIGDGLIVFVRRVKMKLDILTKKHSLKLKARSHLRC